MAELRFSDALLDEIRAAVPITEVVGSYVIWDDAKSNPGRRDMWANCPLHGESSPSFHAEDEKGKFHCFGCGKDGDHFEFLVKLNGWDFPTAVRAVAEIAGIDVPGAGEQRPVKAPEQPRKGNERPQPSAGEIRPEIVKTYDYTDRDGALLFQVCRLQRKMPDGTWALNKDGKGIWKTFLHRRPAPDGQWIWSMAGGEFMRRAGGDWKLFNKAKFSDGMETRFFDPGPEHTIYRHPAVEIAIAEGRPVLIVEGEKDADTAVELEFCGTTNSSGASHWTAAHAECFRDADVVICIDNDVAGDRADKIAMSLIGIARSIRILNFADHVEGFDHKGDITDWVQKFGGTADRLSEIIAYLPNYRRRPPASKFGAMSSRDVAGSEIVYDWLIKGLIERNGVFLVVGESMAGKSFLVKDLGMKVARGVEYGGRKVQQGLVVHVAVEDGKGTKLRQKGYRKRHQISPDADVPYIVMDPSEGQGFTLMTDESVDAMISELQTWEEYVGQKLELVIIDTYSMATEGLDEIDGAGTGKVLARINRIREQTGAAVCIVHHMNASGTRVRGHSSLVANVPNVIEVRPMMSIPKNKNDKPELLLDGDGRAKRRAILVKNKNGVDNVKWTFVLEVVEVGLDADGVPVTTCVCARPTENKSDDAPERQKLSDDQKLVYDALVAAQTETGQEMPHNTSAGPQVKRCAQQAAFVANVRKTMTFKAEESDEEGRKAEIGAFLKRTTTTLINGGYMGRDNDLKIVWWTGKSDRPRPRHNEPEQPPPQNEVPAHVMQEIRDEQVPF